MSVIPPVSKMVHVVCTGAVPLQAGGELIVWEGSCEYPWCLTGGLGQTQPPYDST